MKHNINPVYKVISYMIKKLQNKEEMDFVINVAEKTGYHLQDKLCMD